MKSSAVNATSSAASISVRRWSLLPPYFSWISSISSRTIFQRPSSSFSRPLIWRARLRLSASSFWMTRISRRASRYSFSSRIASVCSASRSKRFMIFAAASALPSDLRMILQDLVERVEDLLEALENVDPLLQRVELVLEPLGHDLEPEVQEVPEDRLEVEALRPSDFGVLGRDEARQVDDEVGLERRVLEQVRHHHPRIGVPLQLELDPHVVGRHVPDVERAAAASATARRRRCARPAPPCWSRTGCW